MHIGWWRSVAGTAPTVASILLITCVGLAACGVDETDNTDTQGPEADATRDRVEQPETEASDAATGSFNADVGGDLSSSFSGEATFVSGAGDYVIQMVSEDENHVIRAEARGVTEDGRPPTGSFDLQRRVRESGFSATYVNRSDDGGGFSVTSGTLQITHVTPERIKGEVTFDGDNPLSGDEIDLAASFTAVCETAMGIGGPCF